MQTTRHNLPNGGLETGVPVSPVKLWNPKRKMNEATNYVLLKQKGQPYAYWWEDDGDRWVNFNGGWWPKSETDTILERAVAENFEDLDHMKADWLRPDSESGWLSPEGRFYGCSYSYHDLVAWLILKKDVGELERSGWARVLGRTTDGIYCLRFLTAEQRNWCSAHGYLFDENNSS